ncbi:MAG: L-rhamnose isomerase [Chlorobi bacterium]|nr:L-rhamnose isomerase [Chlorobiota bacterium]
MNREIISGYRKASEKYADCGIDTDLIIDSLENTALSVHCWQADDVGGFENAQSGLEGSGLQVTGNYPGKPRAMDEFRDDLQKVFSLIPGHHRLSLHASYGDFSSGFPGRDKIAPEHFQSWIDWAKDQNLKIDFNSTFFAHPMVKNGYTLSGFDKDIRNYWIEHGKKCREISSFIGQNLNDCCIHNIWIPDGSKDITPSKMEHRTLLKDSLDRILEQPYPPEYMKDAVESKLFGIGSETFVAGSHEFYLGYAIRNNLILTLDIGHFHPTESVADKISAVYQYLDEVLLHVTRGLRWDSDHIVTLNDPVTELMQEIVWSGKLMNTHIGLDFFDATLNRIGAYVLGARNTQKALLQALLLPSDKLKELDRQENYFERLALLEEFKTMPFGAVWDYFCLKNNVPPGDGYIEEIRKYEKNVLMQRK